jgi:FixJ family two-component response regulator
VSFHGCDETHIRLKSNLRSEDDERDKAAMIASGRVQERSTQLRVAILDDDSSVCRAISRLLKSSRIAAEAYSSSGAFFEGILREELAPDCIVLDLQMPGMSGFEVMDCLNKAGMRIPIVIITAHDEPGSRDACLSAGAFRYLCKPLDAGQLLDSIAEAVAASQP